MTQSNRNGADLGIVFSASKADTCTLLEADTERNVKVQQKGIKGDLSTKRNVKVQTEAESKIRNT